MKFQQMRLFYFGLIVSFYIPYCNAQIKISKELQEDILITCAICKKDTTLFNSYYKNKFHLAHFFYEKNIIDSSFIYVSKLLEEDKIFDKKKKYILFYLKGCLLKRKSLHKTSNYSFKKAISFIDNNASINNLYIHLSSNYIYQKKYDAAIAILEDWKKNYTKLQKSFNVSKNFHNLGIAYLHIENYKKSEENLLKSHQLNILSKDTLNLAYSSVDLANLYYNQYKDSLAIVYFKKGLAYAKKSNDLTILQSAYQNMAIVEENRKEYEKALFFRKKHEKIKDSIWNRDKIWKLAQTDKTIAAAINKEKLNAELSKTKRILLFASILLLLLLIVSFTGYKINKQRKLISKQKEGLEDLHKLKNDLFAILGHDLRAPMHHILNINKQMLVASKQTENTLLSGLISKNSLASNKMQLILDNILHWILLKNKQSYFRKELVNIHTIIKLVEFDFEALLLQKSIESTIKIDESLNVFADVNSLKVILRNVLDNAIKFTPENGHITIKGTSTNNTTTISISDTGIGMKTDNNSLITLMDTDGKKSTGLGLQLCKSFMKRNNGHFKIESKKGIGTTVFISLPNNKT